MSATQNNSLDEGGDAGTSFQELKTPTGQPAGHYVTPTSQINLAQSKKPMIGGGGGLTGSFNNGQARTANNNQMNGGAGAN